MMLYLFKTILCSGLLLLGYRFLLQSEKMLRFNRFYLLLSLLFSFAVPLIHFSVPTEILLQPQVIASEASAGILVNVVPENNPVTLAPPVEKVAFTWWYLVAAIYAAGCGLMLFRFSKNIFLPIAATRKNEVQKDGNAQLVLIDKPIVPHSFFHFIFLNKHDYENGLIQPEVLCHERTHIQQKHSFDIILIELLLAFCWFNPVLYFYRKAIRLNHEFLADEAVIKRFENAPFYQQLLLQTATVSAQPFPASSFTYSITKKRFLMMTKNTSLKIVIAKGTTICCLLAMGVFVFSTRTGAQVKDTTKIKRFPGQQIEASSQNAPEDVVAQFQVIVASYHLDTVKYWKNYRSTITAFDRKQLETLYKKMSREQQQQQVIGFMPQIPPFPTNALPTTEFEDFKNSKVYGVWVNGKKIPNKTLNQYKAADFAQFGVSKLYGPAKAGRIYSYQVNMMTKDYYQKYYDAAMAKKDRSLMYGIWWSKDRKMEGHYVISR